MPRSAKRPCSEYHLPPMDRYATALYYTLSTIAQTLAGTLSVLVAVILFRLGDINNRISMGEGLGFPHLRSLRDPVKREEKSAAYGSALEQVEAAWVVRGRLRWAVIFSLIDVAFCFGALPFTPRIACSWGATVVVLGTAAGLGIWCVALYGRLIAALVWRDSESVLDRLTDRVSSGIRTLLSR